MRALCYASAVEVRPPSRPPLQELAVDGFSSQPSESLRPLPWAPAPLWMQHCWRRGLPQPPCGHSRRSMSSSRPHRVPSYHQHPAGLQPGPPRLSSPDPWLRSQSQVSCGQVACCLWTCQLFVAQPLATQRPQSRHGRQGRVASLPLLRVPVESAAASAAARSASTCLWPQRDRRALFSHEEGLDHP